MKMPHRCPVCTGLGHVSEGWYLSHPGCGWSGTGVGVEPCRSCVGTGIVWSDDTLLHVPTEGTKGETE